MKKIIVFIVAIIFLFFFSDRIVALILDKIYLHSTSGNTSGKLTYIIQQKENFDEILFGASKCTHNIVPDSLGNKCFNLGFGGAGILFQYGLISVVEQNKKLPKKIVLQIEEGDYFVSEKSLKDTVRLYDNLALLKYYYNKNEVIKKLIDSVSPSNRYKYLLQTFRFNGNFSSLMISYLNVKKSVNLSNGFDPFLYKPADSLKVLLLAEQGKENLSIIKSHINPKAFYYLAKFIEVCHRNNINLVCYCSPVFNGNLKNYPDKKILLDFLKQKNISCFDFNLPENKIEELNNSKYWFDGVHLNTLGASVLSHHLKNKLTQIHFDEQ